MEGAKPAAGRPGAVLYRTQVASSSAASDEEGLPLSLGADIRNGEVVATVTLAGTRLAVADVDEVRFLVADSCLVMEMSLSDETRRLNGRLYRSARIVFAASGEGFDGVVTTGPSPGTPLRWTGTLVRP